MQRTCDSLDDVPSLLVRPERGSYTQKICLRIFQKILSHSCPSWRLLDIFLLDAHSVPQPINRGTWAPKAARIQYWIQQLLRDVIFPLKPFKVNCYRATTEVYLRGRLWDKGFHWRPFQIGEPGWEAFVLGYTSEIKIRPLHRVYVSVTVLYLALSSK
jgi:hypothetical protein